MTVENFISHSTSPNDIKYSQALIPSFLRGSFVGDDTENHDFIADGRGKGRLTIAMYTTGTSTYTVSMYGQHSSESTPGANDNFFIGSFAAFSSGASSTAGGYETVADPFPFYMARIQKTDTADASAPTNRVYMNFSAF